MHGFPENDTRRRKCANDGRMAERGRGLSVERDKGLRKIYKERPQCCRTELPYRFQQWIVGGEVNKAKAFKRNMFNKAGPAVLRAKLLYAD